MKKISGKLIASNATVVDVVCGFAPDYVELILAVGGTELIFRWYRALYEMSGASAANGMYGLADDGAGVLTHAAAATNGIVPYATSARGVLIESPKPGIGKRKCTVQSFAAAKAATVTPVARSATVIGTIIRATTANGLVYECTTSGGAMTSLTEPTWGTTIGGTTSDGSNTWTCRMEETCEVGGVGFEIGAAIMTNGQIVAFVAEQHDRLGDFGDGDDAGPLTLPEYMGL